MLIYPECHPNCDRRRSEITAFSVGRPKSQSTEPNGHVSSAGDVKDDTPQVKPDPLFQNFPSLCLPIHPPPTLTTWVRCTEGATSHFAACRNIYTEVVK